MQSSNTDTAQQKTFHEASSASNAPQSPQSFPQKTSWFKRLWEDIKASNRDKDQYREAIEFFVFVGLGLIASMAVYSAVHGINYFGIPFDPQMIFHVDFVGGGRNAFSIGIEATVWAFWGVSCRITYSALKALEKQEFGFYKYTAIWLGTIGFSWGISVAFILSLSVISITVGDTQITLADASIETIMTIAFVIGFFNEHSPKLLEGVKERLTGAMEPKNSDEK